MPKNESKRRRKRKPYAKPTLSTVPIASDEALLAVCAFSSSTSGSVFQGAPCTACFSSS